MPRDESILLIAHGSRSDRAVSLARSVAVSLRSRAAPCDVELAFLDYADPRPVVAAKALAAQGARHIAMWPLLLLEANHLRDDIPAVQRELAEALPDVAARCLPPVGQLAEMAQWSARQRRDARARLVARIGHEQPCGLLLIGRGGNQPGLTERLPILAGLTEHERSQFSQITSLLLTDPDWESVVRNECQRPCVVQAHLLFDGGLSAKVAAAVSSATSDCPCELIRAAITVDAVDAFCEAVLYRRSGFPA